MSSAKPVPALGGNDLLNRIAEKQLDQIEAGEEFSNFVGKDQLARRANEFIEGFSKIEQVADEGADGPHDVINKIMFNKKDKDKKGRNVLLDASLKHIGFAHRKIKGDNIFVAVLVDKFDLKQKTKIVEKPKKKKDGKNLDELKQAFDLFDVMSMGKIDPKECVAAMKSLSYHVKNPTLFDVMAELDTPENHKQLIDFDQFVDHITSRIEDTNSEDGIRRIFDLFIDDPSQDTITLTTLRKICRELGETQSNEELTEIISRASGNGTELTFEEFYAFMVRKFGNNPQIVA